jgi:hypothetical protein
MEASAVTIVSLILISVIVLMADVVKVIPIKRRNFIGTAGIQLVRVVADPVVNNNLKPAARIAAIPRPLVGVDSSAIHWRLSQISRTEAILVSTTDIPLVAPLVSPTEPSELIMQL